MAARLRSHVQSAVQSAATSGRNCNGGRQMRLLVSCRGYTGKSRRTVATVRTPADFGMISDEEVRQNTLMVEQLSNSAEGEERDEALRKLIFEDMMVPNPDEPVKVAFVLKFVWSDKFLGVTLDQATAKGSAPMCPYFFWPREDAWEKMSLMMETKEWIPEQERVNILNTTTEVINFWQDENENHSVEEAREKFEDCLFMGSA